MAKKIASTLRSLGHKLIGKEAVEVDGSVIPSPDRRWCGPEFKDDRFYLESAEREARRHVDELGLSKESRVLDIGCGQGRLPIGILRVVGEVDYTGLDVDERSIAWCTKHIHEAHPTFRFAMLDVYNERYNPEGQKLDEDFRFPIEDGGVDIINLFSVFSHMEQEEMKVYLEEFGRILSPGGGVFFTTFVEEEVPDFEVNPDGYRLKCSGPLHVVRYRKGHIEAIVDELGFDLVGFTHATEADGQSALYLRSRGLLEEPPARRE